MSNPVQGEFRADWYYIGHYGQLGPLTMEQMEDLVRDGVIERSTYVWKSGMSDWVYAETAVELTGFFKRVAVTGPPPAPTMKSFGGVPPTVGTMAPPPSSPRPFGYQDTLTGQYPEWQLMNALPESDRSRVLAGILQFILPGVGRMYLGYVAHGVLQFILAPCLVGLIWSYIDGIVMLTGGLKLDGYGRRLNS